ncbi:hypothetical protein NDN08_002842 [Rhodosorus marinus]|uniref:Uncharacterized protein n=1 Tax=Rhodosorus marinus TaxID=101924 RepID=A0AAV8UV07_9RHOD|nr:hypothetical protein NDN08_002842 [Rhodosorus marinus]
MQRIRARIERVSNADTRFKSISNRAPDVNRLASLGDLTLFFVDDDSQLFMVDLGIIGGVWKVVLSEPVEDIESIAAGSGDKLLVLWSTSSAYIIEVDTSFVRTGKPLRVLKLGSEAFAARPGLKIIHVEWHPRCEGHIGLFTSDSSFWLFNVAKSVEEEEQRILVGPTNRVIVSFAFGPASASNWEVLTVYFTSLDASIFALCPVAPHGLSLPISVAASLVSAAEKRFEETIPQYRTAEDSSRMLEDAEFGNESSFLGGDFPQKAEPRRILDFQKLKTDPTAFAADPRAEDSSATWWTKQARIRLGWVRESLIAREGDPTRAIVRKPRSFSPQMVPLLQGPMYLRNEALSTDRIQRDCHEITVLDNSPTVIFRSMAGNRIDVLLAHEEIEPVWKLSSNGVEDSGDEEEENLKAGEEVAPGLISFEQVKLPGWSAEETVNRRSLNSIGKVFALRGKRAEPAVFVRCAAGLLCLRMPWLNMLESNDPEQVANVPVSLLSAQIATGHSAPIGGAGVFTVPEGTIGVILTSEGLLQISSMAKSMRDWGIESAPTPIARRKRDEKDGPSGSAFETHLGSVVASLPSPVRLDTGAFSKMSLMEAFKVLLNRKTNMQGTYFGSFAQLHELITERSTLCRDLTREQRKRTEELEDIIAVTQDKSSSVKRKLDRCNLQYENLAARVRMVMQIINDGSAKLSKAEERQLADYKLRNAELENRRTRVQGLAQAARQLQEEVLAQRTTESSTRSNPLILRTADRKKIHQALEDHSTAVQRALETNDELCKRLRRLALESS